MNSTGNFNRNFIERKKRAQIPPKFEVVVERPAHLGGKKTYPYVSGREAAAKACELRAMGWRAFSRPI